MLKALLIVASLTLTGCATRYDPVVEPIVQPAPVTVDPRLCADLVPEPPVLGSIVAPVTDEERAATGDFLTGEAEARQWGRDGWERARIARLLCLRPPRPG